MRRDWVLPPGLSSVVLAVAGGVLLSSSCAQKEPKKPPPPPPMCATFERGGSEPVGEVLCAQKDSDGDQVDDAVDLCPDLAEIHNDLEDQDGCPDPDQDRDGKVDYEDGCPTEAGTDANGCPIQDKDGDTIADHLDGCPHQPEDLDGEDDADGCPEGEFLGKADADKPQLWQGATITFRHGKARPNEPGARTLLELLDLVEPVHKNIMVVKVQVAVAVSERSSKFALQQLAQERAQHIQRVMAPLNLSAKVFDVSIETYGKKDPRDVGEAIVEVYTRPLPLGPHVASPPTDGGVPDTGSDPF